MARTSASHSDDSTSFDRINFVTPRAPLPKYMTGSAIADMMWLDSEPKSKSHLSRCLAHIYDYQEEPGAAPLPNFNEFLTALARPRWRWTPQASTVFRRIGHINHDFHRFGTVQVTQREIIQRRRASLRRCNSHRRIAWERGFRSSDVND